MPLTPLLPLSDSWPPQADVGLQEITAQDYQRNLSEKHYLASDYGIPSPLACAHVFAFRLEQYLIDVDSGEEKPAFQDTFDLWWLLLHGLYLGALTTRPVSLEGLRALGEVVRAELPDDFALEFLVFEGKVVGITFPGIGFAPSVRLRGASLDRLRRAVERRSVQEATDYLAGWVHTFDEEDLGELLFFRLLYRAVEVHAPDAPGTLPFEAEKLFGHGPRLLLSGGDLAESVRQPRVPAYQGTPLVCDRCRHEIDRTAGPIEIQNPVDFECSQCGHPHDWLGPHADWIRFDELTGRFLIYAVEGSPAVTEPTSKRVELESDGVTIRDGILTLKVLGTVISERALKCRRLTFFRDGDQEREPDLPVKGAFYGLVEPDEERRPGRNRRTGDYVARIRVRGWREPIVLRYSATEIHVEEALILSWPNFKRPGWNVYYYLLETTPQMNKAGIKVRALDRQAAPRLLEESRGQLDRSFDALEVVFVSEDGVREEAGIFESKRLEEQLGEAPITLALDFGTSASSLWYRIGQGAEKVLRFRDFTETVVGNRQISDRVLRRSYWLPTYRLDDGETAERFYREQTDDESLRDVRQEELVSRLNPFLPSELILSSEDGLNSPLSGFRVCHAYASKPHGEVLYEIKTEPVDGDAEGRFSYEQAIGAYLEGYLVQALATIVKAEPRAGQLLVRASFPRAFDGPKIRRYLECVEGVTQRVQTLTGFPTTEFLYVDEARAAALSMPASEGFSLVLDMGGGTTDIGLFERKGDELVPLFLDSLLYGGNGFLRLLASEENASLFPRASEQPGFDHRLLWLLREIRLRGFKSVVQHRYHANPDARRAMLDLLHRFYAPIAHFTGRLFQALTLHRESEKDLRSSPVSFYLVGNGWSLADALPAPKGDGRDGRRAIFQQLLEEEGFENLVPISDPSVEGWPGPKGAVGYGMVRAEPRLLYRGIEAAVKDVHGIKTISGFDFPLTNGTKRQVDVSWHQGIPLSLSTRELRPVLSEIDIPAAWQDFIRFDPGGEVNELEEVCKKDIVGTDHPRLTRSPLVRFLERVYRQQLGGARRH